MESNILNDYDQNNILFSDFTKRIYFLIKELLYLDDNQVHSVTYRVKDRSSLKGKIERIKGKYTNIDQLTDIAGIRIITYLNDDVDRIASLIEQEFQIDHKNSVDKRAILDPDRFGYLSLHYVIKLKPDRLSLREYERFKDCKAEVQIRTILQHAWAEIEHDLGYKSKQAVPKEIIRSFSRLASLLEIADSEFMRIRDNLDKYGKEVQSQIESSPEEVFIDKISLHSFLSNDLLVKEIDEEIAEVTKNTLSDEVVHIESYLNYSSYFNLFTISELTQLLMANKKIIVDFAKEFVDDKVGDLKFNKGVSLFYLCYVLAGKSEDFETIKKYLIQCNIGIPNEAENTAEQVLNIYLQAKKA